MAKDAKLGSNLVDQLVPMVDDLRISLFADMGVRPLRVFLVRRLWSGGARGNGSPSFVSQVEITPAPALVFADTRYNVRPSGTSPDDVVTLTEISLQFTEGELTGRPILEAEDFYYRVADGHGQAVAKRYYTLDGDPVPDREKAIGWEVHLRRVEIQE